MKRVLAILLAITFLFLAGCDSLGAEEESVDTTRSYLHQNQQIHAAETADTIYLGSSDQFINYVDKESGISGVLCGKPECGHDGEDCNAWAYLGVRCLFIQNERLYWIGDHYPHETQQPYSLYNTALDGTDRREVRLPDEFPAPNGLDAVLFEDGTLTAGVCTSTVENGEEVTYQKIASLDLESGAVTTILNERAETGNHSGIPIQLYDGWLYFLTCEGPWGEGTHRIRIRRYNTASGETETLYDAPNSTDMNWIKDMWVEEQGVLFMAYDHATEQMGLYRYGFSDGHLDLVCDTGVTDTTRGGIADGIVSGFTFQENDGSYAFHVVIKDFDGQAVLDETYEVDLAGAAQALMDDKYGTGAWSAEDFHWNLVSGDLLGRDETNVYYALDGFYVPNHIQQSHITTMIQVPLDGSGASVLCSFAVFS